MRRRDEFPIGGVGGVVAVPPKRELNPYAFAPDLADRGAS